MTLFLCLDFFVAINFIRTKSSMHFSTCLFMAVVSMRQDEAVTSFWFWPSFFFLEKLLIEKIIPRNKWIG